MNKFCRVIKGIGRYRFCQYSQRNPTITYTDEFTGKLDQDGKLSPVSETGVIHEVDDKYGLEEVRNPTKILAHLKSVNFDYPFDELVYFIRHLVHISEVHGTRNQIVGSNNFKDLLTHIKKSLRQSKHGLQPLIGSYAYCMQKLDVNDQELWQLLEQKVLDDQFYTSFKESVYAVQGFTKMPRMLYGQESDAIQKRIDQVYRRLERIIRITIWEVDVKYYHQIVMSLAKVNRFDPETFAKLEQHILTNLSYDYSPQMMVDILAAFAKGKQGSSYFYDAIQYIIFKGHMFNRNKFLQKQVLLRYDGQLVVSLLEIYKEAKNKFDLLQLHPDFNGYIHNLISNLHQSKYIFQLANSKTHYNLETAVKTLELLPFYNFEDQKEAKLQILEKISKLEGQLLPDDILAFYRYLESSVQDATELPKAALAHIESNIFQYCDQMMFDDLIDILCYLYERPTFLVKPLELSNKVAELMEQKLQYLDLQQIERFNSLFQNYLLKLANQNQIQPQQTFEQNQKPTFKSIIGRLFPKKSIQKELTIQNKSEEQQINAYQQLSRKLDDFNKIKKLQAQLNQNDYLKLLK